MYEAEVSRPYVTNLSGNFSPSNELPGYVHFVLQRPAVYFTYQELFFPG